MPKLKLLQNLGSGCRSLSGFFRHMRSKVRIQYSANFIKNTWLLASITVNCIEQTKIKKKRPGMAHLKNYFKLFRQCGCNRWFFFHQKLKIDQQKISTKLDSSKKKRMWEKLCLENVQSWKLWKPLSNQLSWSWMVSGWNEFQI